MIWKYQNLVCIFRRQDDREIFPVAFLKFKGPVQIWVFTDGAALLRLGIQDGLFYPESYI